MTARFKFVIALLVGAFVSGASIPAAAHCDTMDGPVVQDARVALEQGDMTPVLKWLLPQYEADARIAFDKATTVRGLSDSAKELADTYFFETVVRLHRLGEGEPYTGLKPAGMDPGPAVRSADVALAEESVESVVQLVRQRIENGIRKRFSAAIEKKHHAEHSVSAGRDYVNVYVEFVHYVKQVYDRAEGAGHSAHDEGRADAKAPHEHLDH